MAINRFWVVRFSEGSEAVYSESMKQEAVTMAKKSKSQLYLVEESLYGDFTKEDEIQFGLEG